MRLGSAKDVKTLFSHFAVALAFRCILLIHDAARQCQRCENVVFPLCRCTRLSLYLQKKITPPYHIRKWHRFPFFIRTMRQPVETQNLASPDWHVTPSLSGRCTCIPQPSSSRDAKSCVSRSACHSFIVRSLHVYSSASCSWDARFCVSTFVWWSL